MQHCQQVITILAGFNELSLLLIPLFSAKATTVATVWLALNDAVEDPLISIAAGTQNKLRGFQR